MSTKGKRDFRPELHYTPAESWINDPNGLVYANGKYHLFCQFYPDDTVWGPMHWGHAVSDDLLHWERLPVALAPDELGYIYSGSAVYDADNTSGFGTKEQPPIVAVFTHHGDHEQQSVAYSTDGVTFIKYPGNPVIPNDSIRDFRDPKLFRNPYKGCWGIVLAAGDRVHFYACDDLKNWTKTGEFGPEGNHATGIWECPDLFPLETADGTRWVLLVSMSSSDENINSRTQYFIGDFDGETFTCDGRFHLPQFIDDGFDNYAGVTFDNLPDRVLMGWGTSWVYSKELPTGVFCGLMTLARKLTLADTPKGGLRLASTPICGIFDEGTPSDTLPGEAFRLTVTGSGAAVVSLENDLGQAFRFGVDNENRLFVDRTDVGAKDFSHEFARELFCKNAVPRFYNGSWTIDLIFDHMSAEIFIDGGTRVMSALCFPDEPYTRVVTEGEVSVTVHRPKS